MTEADFEEFLRGCVAKTQARNDALDAEYHIHSYPRWDDDSDKQLLVFSDPRSRDSVEANVVPIGTYSLKTKTWLWAWANESISDEARAQSSLIQGLFAETGMRIFGDPHFNCDEFLAWELAAAAVVHLDTLGCYREPVDHLWIFVAITAIRAVRRE